MGAPATVSVEVRGAKELEAALKKGGSQAKFVLGNAANLAGRTLASEIKGLAPVKTGHLRDSIKPIQDGARVTVRTGVKYAPFLEHGTKAHGPVTARFLRFKIDGKWIYTKRVRGIKPIKFFARGYDRAKDRILSYYTKALDEIVQYLATA